MSGIDLPLLSRIRLPPRPILQRVLAYGALMPNFAFLPGVEIVFDGSFDPKSAPVIVAVNHTDRYGYFPLAFKWWCDYDRFFAAWAKGKYFENPLLGLAIQKIGGIPTVSRGYIISRDFKDAMGRKPDDNQYRALREWIDRAGTPGESPEEPAELRRIVPGKFLDTPRNVLGRDFNPATENYAQSVNALFTLMMGRFMEIHRKSFEAGRDLMIFPEGTRSPTLATGRTGIAQLALHFRMPVIPIGCNGSDLVYPGACPLAMRGRVVYRIGKPITADDLAPFETGEPFIPFTPEAEFKHAKKFRAVTDLVMDRLNSLLDGRYRRVAEMSGQRPEGAQRFI